MKLTYRKALVLNEIATRGRATPTEIWEWLIRISSPETVEDVQQMFEEFAEKQVLENTGKFQQLASNPYYVLSEKGRQLLSRALAPPADKAVIPQEELIEV